MTHYDRVKKKRLGDILVDEHLANEEVVIAALHEQQRSGRLLSDILLENREISEWDLARVIVEQYQTPFIEMKNYTVHKDLIAVFPRELLHAARVVPLDRFGKTVAFACQEVPTPEIVEHLKKHSPGGLYIFTASAVEIRQVLQDFAPLTEQDRKAIQKTAREAAPAPQALAAMDPEEDSAWKDLFDAANESILSDLKDGG